MKEAFAPRRLAIAVLIAGVIYGLAVGIGSGLYATGNIATGATHNTCSDYRTQIAEARGIDEEDVPQSEIKRLTEECLATHELTEEEAFRTEYLFWSIWPGVISALVFLVWPAWSRILFNQESHDEAGGGHSTPRHA